MFPNVGEAQQKDAGRPDDAPWWLRYLGRIVGTVSSLFAIGLGAQLVVVSIVTFSSTCIFSAILQMLAGTMVALIEAPCFCTFLEFAQAPGNFFDRKPHWYKALLYGVTGVLPVALCAGLTTFFGGGLIFLTGLIYGIMAMGRKASADEMRARATSTANLVSSGGGEEAAAGDTKMPSN
ncbi:calcium channel flower-like [Ornithodoros turicata]|uniref:calcium channel flower-like n=1 Tax=Ornithodoros turicata TaxID=34597 RepID=UPI003139F118